MKRYFLLLLLFLPLLAKGADSSLVFVLNIDSEIHAKSARMLDKALQEAKEQNAMAFVMRLNTFGGALDAAEKMRTALLEAPFTTVSFIDHQAASAGALISIACDTIYMAPGSTIGSASVVNQTGEPMPEKYQSYMRSLMRATAEETGRDPRLAEQMVSGDTIVNLTTREAIEAGLSQGQAASVEEAVALLGYENHVIKEYEETWLDKVIGFFLLPLVQALMLMGMIGGIYFELQSPGIGFPLGVAVFCAIGYFSPLFLEGLVQYWEIIIIIAGLILLAVEIFVTPGFGVLGILGLVAIGAGLTLTMIDNRVFDFKGPFPWKDILVPVATVSVTGLLALSFILFSVHMLFPTRVFNRIALRTNLETEDGFVGVPTLHDIVIGQEGVTFTDLRPSGKVTIAGRWVEARAAIGYIPKGTPVKVVRIESGAIFVETL
ncbi:MAG: nodulation protein NfeD [Bacteroidales bacterium]|nr:nodulation protein NfeD [Bacteroidales bacterium]HNW22365.1 NfeD family protein [Bacteroidales bacterium]HOT54631.1 NfeD family protein [Bacteroidales bacterium]HOZ10164.1 NfeD family protein [Bacteroidales bacterium]HPU82599.1 NfeD family protein [Bacteroidales bacterium]